MPSERNLGGQASSDFLFRFLDWTQEAVEDDQPRGRTSLLQLMSCYELREMRPLNNPQARG